MSRQKIDQAKFDRIFGPPDIDYDDRVGRKRVCKICGGWHLVDAWPHNCRPPKLTPPQRLSAPMVMADVEPHMPEPGVVIGSRKEQREYMREKGVVEFEAFNETAGTHKQLLKEGDHGYREYEKELVQDIKKAIHQDPEYRPPPQAIEEVNEKATAEEAISTEGMEVVGDEQYSSPA